MQLLHFEREFFKPLHIVAAFLKELFPILTEYFNKGGGRGERENNL
jgi:hypothetical protein